MAPNIGRIIHVVVPADGGEWMAIELDSGVRLKVHWSVMGQLKDRFGQEVIHELLEFRTDWRGRATGVTVLPRPGSHDICDDDRLERAQHAAYGARTRELQAALRAHGFHGHAGALDEAAWTVAFKNKPECFEHIANGPHGVVWCAKKKGHSGDHVGRCFPCDLVRQILEEIADREGTGAAAVLKDFSGLRPIGL